MSGSALSGPVKIYAGKGIIDIIRDEGFNPDRVAVMPGAAGGPKWLVLYGLDRALSSLFEKRKDPLYCIGSSIGSWRFFASALGDKARDRFLEAYIEQRYQQKPTAQEVTEVSREILDFMVEKQDAGKTLEHPWMRLSFLSVRSRHLVASENSFIQMLGLAGAFLSNAVSRKSLGLFFERTLFYDSRDIPPFYNVRDFSTQRVPLSSGNIVDAVLASGSIPLVMQGISKIEEAPKGVYRDGGMIDYHPDIEFLEDPGDRVILYPHYTDRIIPGWLDKKLAWRKPVSKSMENLLFVCPSREAIDTLPLSKIPDRNDFFLFLGRDRERMNYWRQVVKTGEIAGDAFREACHSGKIKEMVEPLPWSE